MPVAEAIIDAALEYDYELGGFDLTEDARPAFLQTAKSASRQSEALWPVPCFI
jgi:hypothetical protein